MRRDNCIGRNEKRNGNRRKGDGNFGTEQFEPLRKWQGTGHGKTWKGKGQQRGEEMQNLGQHFTKGKADRKEKQKMRKYGRTRRGNEKSAHRSFHYTPMEGL